MAWDSHRINFGHYSYGETLGFKYEDVPIIIGLNWYLLAYISTDLSARTKFPLFVKVILGALFMTAIDYLIEPIAIRFGFWFWHSGQIPLSNYVGWFWYHFLCSGLRIDFILETIP